MVKINYSIILMSMFPLFGIGMHRTEGPGIRSESQATLAQHVFYAALDETEAFHFVVAMKRLPCEIDKIFARPNFDSTRLRGTLVLISESISHLEIPEVVHVSGHSLKGMFKEIGDLVVNLKDGIRNATTKDQATDLIQNFMSSLEEFRQQHGLHQDDDNLNPQQRSAHALRNTVNAIFRSHIQRQ